ncbi:MAG: acetyl-CoA carboxylase biotin carboxylase subunit family protein [Eubacteriales bacterium]
MDKLKAIVLGGTIPHIELIKNLQKRGYYTILVDYYQNPPAKSYADEHIIESTLDQDVVLEIAQKLDVQLVISTCVDQANVTACYVAEKLGLPAPYSYEAALNVTNKGLMKKKMVEYAIPTSKYFCISNKNELENLCLEFPVVVKPSDSTGSKGVKKANNFSELYNYFREALGISRNNNVIIEEFQEGIEVQVDFFIQNKEPNIVMTRQKSKISLEFDSVLQSTGSIIPADLSQAAKDSFLEIANNIANAFNLKNTSLFIQAIVNGDDINVLEFAPRIGGGLSYRLIKLITGFDILDATVDSYLNIPIDVLSKQPKFYYSTNIIYAFPGKFDSIQGYQELIDRNIIEEFYIFKTKGMEIGSEMASRDRVGAFLLKANKKADLHSKMLEAIDEMEVYDSNGDPIMRHDIFI